MQARPKGYDDETCASFLSQRCALTLAQFMLIFCCFIAARITPRQ
jgi:hypothetical protein